MKLLADENIERPIILQMREWGYDVAAVSELLPGADDAAVLSLAAKESRTLITNDTDFGEMVFNQKLSSAGIILMRFSREATAGKIKAIEHLLNFHQKKLANHFTVISERQIKIRPIG